MRIPRISGIIACALLTSLAACGSDSTGPSNLDANSALQSLRLGLAGISDIEGPAGATVLASFGVLAPKLDQVTVNFDGKSQSMFALGLRESYPPGTCEEDIFVDPNFPPQPGVCTPTSLEVFLLLWQSRAANTPPDRLVLVVADEGTTNLDFTSASSFPGVAAYLEGTNPWISLSGQVTSHVIADGSTCTVPLPAFAKAATCSLATFSEQATVTFTADPTVANSAHRTMSIAPQSIHGLWLAITEIQPLSFPPSTPVLGLFRNRARR